MTSEMVKRVGGAVLLAQTQWNPTTAKESLEVVMGRAALEAMYDVTDEMSTLGKGHWDGDDGEENARDLWREMIDAALT